MLKQLLEKWACKHKWERYSRMNVYRYGESEERGDKPEQMRDTLICEICGKVKKITL